MECELGEITRLKREKEDFYQHKIDKLEQLLDTFTINYQHLSDDYNVSLENQLFRNTQLQTLKKLVETEEHRLSILPTDKPLKRRSSLSVDQERSTLDIEVVNNNTTLVISDWSYQYGYIAIKNISQVVFYLNYFLIASYF